MRVTVPSETVEFVRTAGTTGDTHPEVKESAEERHVCSQVSLSVSANYTKQTSVRKKHL